MTSFWPPFLSEKVLPPPSRSHRELKMKISPHYDAIKARALELLIGKGGFNGFSVDEMRTLDGWSLRNCVGVALCTARDEQHEMQGDPQWSSRFFTTGNFRKCENEIVRAIKTSRPVQRGQ